MLYHAGIGVTGGGFVGVDVFFVLSGFLITGLLWRELQETGRISFSSFYARRARRLLPAAVLVLVVTVVASVRLLSPLTARAVTKDAVAAALYVANYRFAAVGTDYLNAQTTPSPLQHYWSLGVEEQFYLFWPLLLLLATVAWRRSRRPSRLAAAASLLVVGAASLLLSLHLTVVSPPWAFFSLPSRAWELAAGGLVALAVPQLAKLDRTSAALLGWAGLGAVLWSITALQASTPFPGTAALVPVGGTAALLAAGCAPYRSGPKILLARRPFQLVGKLSYSWYLWHWPLLVIPAAAAGHALPLLERLALAAASGVLALATVRVVEDPVRFSGWLRVRPRRGLAVAAALTAVATTASVASAAAVPSLQGGGAVAAVPRLPQVRVAARAPSAAVSRLDAVLAPVVAAVARGVAVRAVPANLNPSLQWAHSDRALPFIDGCHDQFVQTSVSGCVYADRTSPRKVVLFGDSHATQWFPALDSVAQSRHWQLISLTKSTCPPIVLSFWSPYLGRPYRECDQWRAAVLARIRAERPALVILGAARHYNYEYHFTVYGPAWLGGLAAMVREVRATGARVVVLGPTPKPVRDVPDCLSTHLGDATACTTPRAQAINAAGMAAERVAVTGAGGAYLDVSPWICTPATCAVIVGNLLVYRDDNHLTKPYTSWLAPVMAAALDEAGSAAGAKGRSG